jgi:hypothetical protein
MASGSLQLCEYPTEFVRLSCAKCGRAGQYRKQTLNERYGADIRLPDLREEVAQCKRRGQMHDTCMVPYRLRDESHAAIFLRCASLRYFAWCRDRTAALRRDALTLGGRP